MRNGARTKQRRTKFRRRSAPGASPGTLITDPEAPKPRLQVIAYTAGELVEHEVVDPMDLCPLLLRYKVVWLNVDGLGDAEVVAKIGTAFNLHRLALEDVLNAHQRAKVENYENHLYLVARMVNGTRPLDTEQLSLFLGENYVITFQERAGDGFEPVRARLRGARGSIRNAGADYLAYALLDAVIDEYFPIFESYGERLDELEEALVDRPGSSDLTEVHAIKRDLLTLRRAVWPLREAVNALLRDTTSAFKKETKPYLADCYDHTVQLMDIVETYREIASGLMDIYLSSMSHRMNEIVKVLTIISTIFIPLTFIAGVYGMNFHTDSPWNMPELTWRYGYVACLALMALVAGGLVYFFKRRGWLGRAAIK